MRPHTLLVNKVRSKVANSSWLAHWPSYLTEVCKSWEIICSKINQNYWSWGGTLTDAGLVPVNCCCFYPPTLVIPCHMKEMMPDISPKSLWTGVHKWGRVLQETDMPVGVLNQASVGTPTWAQGSTKSVPVSISASCPSPWGYSQTKYNVRTKAGEGTLLWPTQTSRTWSHDGCNDHWSKNDAADVTNFL